MRAAAAILAVLAGVSCTSDSGAAEASPTPTAAAAGKPHKSDGASVPGPVVQHGGGEGYGSFAIMDELDDSPDFSGGNCRRPAVNEKVVFLCTGAQYGAFTVTAQSLPSRPTTPETGWEEVFDVEVSSQKGLYFWPGGGPERWPGLDRPLTHHGPGRYHVRIHITGRLANEGHFDNITDEEYLIQVWKTH